MLNPGQPASAVQQKGRLHVCRCMEEAPGWREIARHALAVLTAPHREGKELIGEIQRAWRHGK